MTWELWCSDLEAGATVDSSTQIVATARIFAGDTDVPVGSGEGSAGSKRYDPSWLGRLFGYKTTYGVYAGVKVNIAAGYRFDGGVARYEVTNVTTGATWNGTVWLSGSDAILQQTAYDFTGCGSVSPGDSIRVRFTGGWARVAPPFGGGQTVRINVVDFPRNISFTVTK
jgi:hypothetical protein